ncbi:MAG: UvrD-helicase domain-containing protein, partial [Desulfosarcina sp.]|nr:UvrD-helicase domain-containing protein [Desulfobacterales bacterium]
NALLDFDRISIFTIHGFCQRILHENAFETGSLFDTELIVDQSSIVQEIADDFWRKHFYKKSPEFLSVALKKLSGPEYYAALLNKTGNSEVRIIPEISEPSLVDTTPFKNNFEKLKNKWTTARDRILILLQDPALNARSYGNLNPSSVIDSLSKKTLTNREVKINELVWEMDCYTAESNIGLPVFKGFEKFTATKIQKLTKKNFDPPNDEFFDICDELFTLAELIEKNVEEYLLYLKIKFFNYSEKELLKRKKKSNIQFFDDLLTRVRNALEQDDGDGNFLLQAARSQYSAALLDEFQDTDPVQFKIFSKIFNSEQHKLFMIGDPKQSIYSFRGADIFSYIKAASDADYKYTLTENWRSAPQLISAVNTIFSNINVPFVYKEIGFNKVTPGKTETADLVLDAPLQLWYLSSRQLCNQDNPINKSDALTMVAEAVSCEIAKLISSKNINEGDIAVLVRKNSQARLIKEYLSQKNIPSVLYNSENIFDSHEAYEIEQVLKAIAEPASERLLRAALVTDMMGVTGDLLYSVENDSFWWERKISQFNEYYNLWTKYGFIRMFGKFMSAVGIRERLLKLRDGDRRVTNILHLAELLHQKSLKKTITISGLIKWLEDQRNNPLRLDEDQIRLESDEQSVKIVTMHKSKGLEYKVVFCAYAWEGSQTKDKEIFFHAANKNKSLVLDLGSEDFKENLALAENEILAENIRLLYVALTRAKSLCYIVWGRINTAATSALSYILHNRNLTSSKNIIAEIKDTFKRKTDTDLMEDLKALADHSDGAIKFVPLPAANDTQPVVRQEEHQDFFYRKFSGNIDTSWK